MKRIKELETLSWEHHDGLVVAFRLQKGLQNKADLQIMKNYLLETWENALTHHFWQEEETLVTTLQNNSAGRDLLKQMKEQHTFFHNLIEKLRKQQGDVGEMLASFADRLNSHIRFEERQLFPFIEQNASQQELRLIGFFLHSHHRKDNKKCTPQFWKTIT